MKILKTCLLVAMLAGFSLLVPAVAAGTERAAILDALRAVVKQMSGLEVVFVVSHLRVKDNWAWIVAEPESRDGKQHYETMSGLLRKRGGRWIYLEGPPEAPICDEDPECVDTARYYLKLAKKYPALSPAIFPKVTSPPPAVH